MRVVFKTVFFLSLKWTRRLFVFVVDIIQAYDSEISRQYAALYDVLLIVNCSIIYG